MLRGEKVRTRTSVRPTSEAGRNSSGFTLIEILLVITLLALLAASVFPSVTKVLGASVQSSVRRYASMVRYVYDQSILTGKVHRIVLDMDKQAWTVEAADAGALPLDKAKVGVLADGLREDDRVSVEPDFKKVGGTLVETMPSGVEIVEVESWRLGKGQAATKGVVSIYAFPSGFIDEATVVLAETGREKGRQFKVSTNSLTGRIKVETVSAQQ